MAAVYKIGAASRKTGLSASTLRLWEDQYGLVAPARTRGGTRLYSESDLERLSYVRHLVRERGYALNAIADVIDNAASRLPYALDRVALENIYLRESTNHSSSEESRRLALIEATVRSLVRAESAQGAAVILISGVMTLTSAHTAGIGLYDRKSHSLIPLVTASGKRLLTSPGIPPLQIDRFPREWQLAIDAREPYADRDILRLELAGELNSQVVEYRTRSFHAEPLAIAHELAGVFNIASSRPGGVGREAEDVMARLALAAGPVMHYFAQRLEPPPTQQPRL
jgi:DNA-binding transcriptional MerR regulator